MVENLLITAAAAWYLSFAVTSTDGPFNIFQRLRNFRDGRWHGRTYKTRIDTSVEAVGDWKIEQEIARNGLLDCIICLIFWLALAIGYLQGLTVLESIAAAGVGLWLHGFTGWLYKQ